MKIIAVGGNGQNAVTIRQQLEEIAGREVPEVEIIHVAVDEEERMLENLRHLHCAPENKNPFDFIEDEHLQRIRYSGNEVYRLRKHPWESPLYAGKKKKGRS